MENFFYSDEFYHELGDLINDLGLSEDAIKALPDDYQLSCRGATLEPVATLSGDWIADHIDEERFSEDGNDHEKIIKMLDTLIDWEKVNAAMPELYYESGMKFFITKADLIEAL